MTDYLNQRQSKIEDAISKLTEISSDLNKMIAVHEQRITQQERITDSFEIILEKRREEFEEKITKLYVTLREEDRDITKQILENKQNIVDNHTENSERFEKLEKYMWMYMGGFSVFIFIIANWGDVAKLIKL